MKCFNNFDPLLSMLIKAYMNPSLNKSRPQDNVASPVPYMAFAEPSVIQCSFKAFNQFQLQSTLSLLQNVVNKSFA